MSTDKNDQTQQNADEQKKGGPNPKLIVAIIGIAALALFFFISGRGKQTTDDAQVYGHSHSVAPRVSGQVLEVLVVDNEMVTKGQELAVIDKEPFEAKVADAEASLAQAQASRDAAAQDLTILKVNTVENLAQSRAAVETAKANLQAATFAVHIAEEAVNASKANLNSAVATLALREFQKVQIAKGVSENPGAASLERVKKSETDFDSAEASKVSADAALTQAEKELATKEEDRKAAEQAVAVAEANVRKAETGPDQVKAAEAQLAAAEASVEAAQAQLDLANLDLSYCTVVAPSDGQVAQRTVEVGNYVMAGTPLMNVTDVATTWVLAHYKETQLEDVRPGQRVEMTSDIYPKWKFEGTVDSIDSGTGAAYGLFPPQNATGNYVKIVQRLSVKIVIPDDERDADRPLKLGMNIVATTYTGDNAE